MQLNVKDLGRGLVTGGIVWTDANSGEVTAAGTTYELLQSNGASAPTWTSTPVLTSLSLTASSNQIVFDSDGAAPGTLTWTPTSSAKTITFPNLTGTPFLLDASSTQNISAQVHITDAAATVRPNLDAQAAAMNSYWLFANAGDAADTWQIGRKNDGTFILGYTAGYTVSADPNSTYLSVTNAGAFTFTGPLSINANSNQLVLDADGAATLTITASPATSSKTLTLPNLTGTAMLIDGGQTVTSAIWNGTVIGLTYGGSGKNLTAVAGGVVWTDADSMEVSGAGSSGTLLISTGTTAPTWTTAVYPASVTQGGILYANANNNITDLTVGSSGKVLTSNGTIPAWSTATFPGTAGAVGTILRSDGTNWLASTITIVDAFAISTIPYASASNVLSSLATANYAMFATSATGVPSITQSPVLADSLTIGVAATSTGRLLLKGITSGTFTLTCAAAAGTVIWTAPTGGSTDFSATGGTSQVLKQTSAGAAITVAQLAASDLSNGTTGSGSVVLATAPTVSAITVSALTSGRVTFAGASGVLTDDADLTFATDTLTMTKGIGTTSIQTPILIGGTGTTSTAEIRATSGVGVATADVKITGGNNGGSQLGRFFTQTPAGGGGTAMPATMMVGPATTMSIGTGMLASAGACLEVNSGTAGNDSTGTGMADLTLACNQANTGGFIGRLLFANTNLSSAGDRRLAQFGVICDGATNSGKFVIATMNAGTLAAVITVDHLGNMVLGPTGAVGTSGAKVLGIENGTVPSTSPADMIQIYSADITAGNASLALRTETAVVSESVVSDRTLSVTINGTVYKICLKA